MILCGYLKIDLQKALKKQTRARRNAYDGLERATNQRSWPFNAPPAAKPSSDLLQAMEKNALPVQPAQASHAEEINRRLREALVSRTTAPARDEPNAASTTPIDAFDGPTVVVEIPGSRTTDIEAPATSATDEAMSSMPIESEPDADEPTFPPKIGSWPVADDLQDFVDIDQAVLDVFDAEEAATPVPVNLGPELAIPPVWAPPPPVRRASSKRPATTNGHP